ncbi:hypothetical protein [Gracilibacillus thailandensis]|uniref:Uncharacterized protein n=1 Tax=Gracilibacillus thailandensis TaxID=563735 RepID=A0A6N7R377_9BACI|nr:hypothetical protein [Gracilibacillus thailandensis]MRI66816.1 hypothetical protein [Gracilibacillus thailandensis]
MMMFIILFVVCASCANDQSEVPTISVNADSEYEKTFTDLNLGNIFDFNFYLPDADQRSVTLWVEKYEDGETAEKPLIELFYYDSPNKVEEGNIGFGMINTETEDTIAYLYSPGANVQQAIRLGEEKTGTTWDYAFGDGEVELELGETKLLAAYRETNRNAFHPMDLQDEEAVNRMIEQGDLVLLLKIKVEESSESAR